MSTRSCFGLCLLAVLIFGAVSAADSVPRLVNYQGLLTDASGERITGAHNLTFRIYADTASASTPFWVETHTAVPVSEGVFSVILGSTSTLADSLFLGDERWLGVTVDADVEISPRFRITSTPWALHAALADSAIHSGSGLGGSGTAGSVAKFTSSGVLGNSVITETGGKVGVGTASPWLTLQVGDAGGTEKKSVAVFGQVDRSYTGNTPDTPQFMTYGGADTRFGVGHSWGALSLVAFDMDTYGAGNVKVFTGNKREGFPSAERLRITANGRVGIGTASPAQLLDVAGTARMTGFQLPTGAAAGYVLQSDATGVGTWQAAGAPSGPAGGDLTGSYPDPTIAAGVVDSSNLAAGAVTGEKIAGSSILFSHIAQNGATLNQVVKWNGSAWVPADDESGTGTYLPVAGGTMTGPITSTGDPAITMGKGSFGTGNENPGAQAFVAGANNRARGEYSAVLGGGGPAASDSNTALGAHSVVVGGKMNVATGEYSSILGGFENQAGTAGAVLGGIQNVASGYVSVAGGRGSHATHAGSFIWNSDFNAAEPVSSERERQVRFAAEGGFRVDDGSQWVNVRDDGTDLISTSTGASLGLDGTWVGKLRASAFTMPMGAGAGYVLTSDESGVASWQAASAPSGPAGGDLTGTYPNPTIAAGAVDSSNLAVGAVTSAKIGAGAVGTDQVAPNVALLDRASQTWTGASNRFDGAVSVDGFSAPTSRYLSLRSGFVPAEVGGLGLMARDHTGDTNPDGLGIYGQDGLSFFTGDNPASGALTERMRIESGTGNVYIGRDYSAQPYKIFVRDTGTNDGRGMFIDAQGAWESHGLISFAKTTTVSGASHGVYSAGVGGVDARGLVAVAESASVSNIGVEASASGPGALAGKFWGDVAVEGSLIVPTGASAGYVLTSDPSGVASWQAAGAPSGPAGGDLTGTYPNPSIADSAVTSAKIADGTVGRADVEPAFKAPYADTADVARVAVGGLTGSGTAGSVAKFTSSGVLGNSVITETGGKVGVGTASPWLTLQVGDAGGTEKKSVAVFGQVDRNYTGNTPDTPQFMTYGGADTRFGVGHSWGALSLVAFDMDTYGAGNVKVFTGNRVEGSPSAERLRITANGRVGIGTASPAQLLDVAGTARMTGFQLPTGAAAGYVLQSDATGVGTWQAAGAPSGPAGGDLTGSYPDPTIAVGAVTSAKVADSTITGSDISGSAALSVASLVTTGDAVVGGNLTVNGILSGLSASIPGSGGTGTVVLCGISGYSPPPLFIVNASPRTPYNWNSGQCSTRVLCRTDGGGNLQMVLEITNLDPNAHQFDWSAVQIH